MRLLTAFFYSCLLAFALPWVALAASAPAPEDLAVPHYAHIFVVMDENKAFQGIDGSADAPVLTRLARTYGDAVRFYAEAHPSEPNYVALLGGSAFGIHDDDAYYCLPRSTRPSCPFAAEPDYVSHVIDAPHLGMQLQEAGLSWKGYYQSIPTSGSDAVFGSDPAQDGPHALPLYAVKHSGFMNFASVQRDPSRREHLVGFVALWHDLAAGTLPSFAFVVPNQCDDMHGLADKAEVPTDCRFTNRSGLIRRGDAAAERIVKAIMASRAWRSKENVAIVLTFDEDDGRGREGCCGVTPDAPSNFGGGHIPTIVIANHGPRGIVDATPYNHYSLLRTIEDAFGIYSYLGIAARSDLGVKPMTPLFRVTDKAR
jgi:phosphatidylinositol-3-phosphatase